LEHSKTLGALQNPGSEGFNPEHLQGGCVEMTNGKLSDNFMDFSRLFRKPRFVFL